MTSMLVFTNFAGGHLECEVMQNSHIYDTIQHLISQYVCTNVALTGKHYSMFPIGQTGLANHCPVFGGVSWCHARF